jgi:hypothetical protein
MQMTRGRTPPSEKKGRDDESTAASKLYPIFLSDADDRANPWAHAPEFMCGDRTQLADGHSRDDG